MDTFANLAGRTQNNASVAMVAGTTSTYTTTVASNACIRGLFTTSLGAQTNQATPTTDAATGLAFRPLTANQCTLLVFGLNAAGAIQMMQGSIEPTDTGVTTTPGAFIHAPQFPIIPDTIVPLAYCLVRTSPTGNAFTPGTTAWAATGITTTTFRNIATLPDRPQIS